MKHERYKPKGYKNEMNNFSILEFIFLKLVRSAGIEQYPTSHINKGFTILLYRYVSSLVSLFPNVPPFYILKTTSLFYFSSFRLLWHGLGAH